MQILLSTGPRCRRVLGHPRGVAAPQRDRPHPPEGDRVGRPAQGRSRTDPGRGRAKFEELGSSEADGRHLGVGQDLPPGTPFTTVLPPLHYLIQNDDSPIHPCSVAFANGTLQNARDESGGLFLINYQSFNLSDFLWPAEVTVLFTG